MTGQWANQRAARGLQGQLGYEGMAQGVNMAQLAAQQQQEALRQGKWQAQMGADAASQANATANIRTGIGVGLGAVSGGAKAAGVMGA